MASDIKFHPGITLMEQYVAGILTTDIALAVAAHIDLCPHCQQLHNDLQHDQASQLTKLAPNLRNTEKFEQMLTFIQAQPTKAAPTEANDAFSTLTINQRTFTIPKSLQRIVAARNKWRHLGSMATAKLPAGDKQHISLLYIAKNTELPHHTHLGSEITLVLSGQVYDEKGCYAAGDLLIRTPNDTHAPYTHSDDDCLCLSVLSAPLKFKKGLLRIFNPLQQFLY